MKNKTAHFTAIATAAILTVSGCTAVADMAGYDTATLNASAAQSYNKVITQANSKDLLDTTSQTSRRIHAVFNRMKPYAERANTTGIPFTWQMNVIKSDQPNAWAMPGGKMAMYTGMVDKLNLTDDEIAAVIGHEMTHALHEHSKKAVGQQVLTGLAADIGSSVLSAKTGISADAASFSAGLLGELGLNMPFSRNQENDADLGGLRLMAQAGYNPAAAVTVWEKMNRIQDNNTTLNALLSTHPTNNARIESIRRMLPEVMPIYQQSRR